MTSEDAITRLRYFKKEDRISRLFPKETREGVQELNDICIEALEKQIPKKVIVEDRTMEGMFAIWIDTHYLCPCCSQENIYDSEYYIEWKHCPDCGQAIDWRGDV